MQKKSATRAMYRLLFHELGVPVDCQLAASKFIGLIGTCDIFWGEVPLQWLNKDALSLENSLLPCLN